MGETSVASGAARLLAIAPLSAAQRSSLFLILARQPDVTIGEAVRDNAGRTGTALSFPFGPAGSPWELLTLILSDDGTVLEVTERAVRDQKIPSSTAHAEATRKGDVISRTTYFEVGGTNVTPGA
ncbi:MAG: hypothetical protein EPO13_12090 [Actinomycetota bacterium]|nr:MAG: hypothetical protein EPO13_12090 [Actinomycetota bacterium]